MAFPRGLSKEYGGNFFSQKPLQSRGMQEITFRFVTLPSQILKRKNALRCRGVDEHLRVGRDDQLAVLVPNEGT